MACEAPSDVSRLYAFTEDSTDAYKTITLDIEDDVGADQTCYYNDSRIFIIEA